MLPTAEIKVFDNGGNIYTTRALLDSASQSNFITESLARRLNLPIHNSNIVINGITRTPSSINKCTTVKISSINNRVNCLLPCLILSQITDDIPQMSFNKNALNLPNHLRSADPSFNISNPVEILIGSTVFWKLIEQGTIEFKNNNNICLQRSKLWWILSGSIPHNGPNTRTQSYSTQLF